MLDELYDKQNIIHIAAAIFLSGFLFRDQIMLRSLVIVGNCVYVVYYYVVVDHPLWGGIFWSVVGIVINAVMIARILADRSAVGLAAHERALHRQIGTLTPGEFRRLMKAAAWRESATATLLTREDQPLPALSYVIAGRMTVEKAGHPPRDIEGPVFIGEVAFVTDHPASATVTLHPGGRYVIWEMTPLRRLLLRMPGIRIGLGAAFNRDMAEKVAKA